MENVKINQTRRSQGSARRGLLCVAALTAGCAGGGHISKPAVPIPIGSSNTVTADGTTVTTTLPKLPQLTNVIGTLREDSVGVNFDPVDGAKDYRIYALPDDGDITAYSDGSLTVKNAIYRCAGLRQSSDLKNNINAADPALTVIGSSVLTAKIDATEANNRLGYVYVTPASDRIPVYALANYGMDGENGWIQSRLKVYTSDADARTQMAAQGWRDDGVVFYVPAPGAPGTHTVYTSATSGIVAGQGWTQRSQFYFSDSARADHQADTTPPAAAFDVLTAAAAGAVPLMAVFYQGNQSHTELAPGMDRFNRAAYQGSSPDWHLEFSGLTAPTTLVVEALKDGCPYPGFLAAQHVEAMDHQTFFTLDELQQASPTGEVYINGQHDNITGRATPVARSFLKVMPTPHKAADWDWYAGFDASTDFTLTEIPGCTDQNCDRWQTPDFDISTYRLAVPNGVPVLAFGPMLGQLWEAFDDFGADTTGKIRFTARTKANVDTDPNKYLHATMSVDIVSTDRRYPQLIISDQDAPIQEAMKNASNNTLLIQAIQGPSMRFEAQAFHGLLPGLIGSWDVNNQAPEHRFVDYDTEKISAQPSDPPFEHASMDRQTKFDVFLSSQRVYLFIDDRPAGCTLLPSDVKFGGPVTYTVGDVLYHEGAGDERVCSYERPYAFMHVHQCSETKRHFDDLAFKNSVPPPVWDNTRFPCLPY
jgi:hypothetical protein